MHILEERTLSDVNLLTWYFCLMAFLACILAPSKFPFWIALKDVKKKLKFTYSPTEETTIFHKAIFLCFNKMICYKTCITVNYHLSHVKIWNLYWHQISFQHACDWQSWSTRITNDFTQKGKLWYLLKLFVRTQASRSWTSIVKFV